MSPKVVLLVEDNPDLRHIMRRILARDGFVCEDAANEEEALSQLSDATSAVVADIDLSETGGDRRGGILLAERLARERSVPIILVSQTPWHYFSAQDIHTWMQAHNIHAVLDRMEETFSDQLRIELRALTSR